MMELDYMEWETRTVIPSKESPTGKKNAIANLYNHRDVERLAWERDRGPDKWEAHLDNLRVSKRVIKVFYEPPDPFAPPYYEDLVKLKSRFPLWLWWRCNEAVRDPANGEPRFFGAKLIKVLSSATSDLGTYPTRPTTPIKTLKSSVELRSLLQNAQTRIAFQGGSQSWNPSYLDDLFSTLNVIINKRGLGKGGWETIRWEVYDKFSAILGGLQCREVGNGKYEWRDNARIWLDGNRVTTDIDFQQTRGLCASGLVYNDKLPVIPPTPAAVGDTLLNFRQE